MNNFKYAAKGPSGQTVEGTIAAATKAEAGAELRKQNLVVMRLESAGGKPSKKGFAFSTGGATRFKAKKSDLVIFIPLRERDENQEQR